jgi:ABC-type bacteriocin/lantibiotic exporter with double-glycine peptidase domain
VTRAPLALTLAAVLVSACATYTGGARPIEPGQVAHQPGWVAAAPTPTVRQRGLSDCGMAALAMVAGRWHVPLSLDQARRDVADPSPRGARLGELRRAARAHGLLAFAISADEATLEHEVRAGRPVIIGLLRPYGRDRALSHYEVVVALRASDGGHEVVTIDPAGGWQVRQWTDLDAEWEPAGRPALVVLGPSED